MEISKIRVANYKSIKEGKIDTGDLNILIGSNNAGKSNIIDALRDYHTIVNKQSGFPGSFKNKVFGKNEELKISLSITYNLDDEEHKDLISDWEQTRSLDEKHTDRIWTEGDFNQFTHSLTFSSNGIEANIVTTNVQGEEIEFYTNENGTAQSLIISQFPDDLSYAGNSNAYQYFRNQILNQLNDWSFLNPKRKVEPRQSPQHSINLYNDASNLERVFHTIYLNDREKYNLISNSYTDIMDGVIDIRTEFLEDDTISSYIVEENFEQGFTLDEISSGSQEILTLITELVLAGNLIDLLLIEEPELHLHPKAQRKIFELMKTVTDDRLQIITSTHSEEFIDESDLDDIILVSRNGSTTLASAQSENLTEHLTTLGYDKSDLLQASGVVFVEGPSDKFIFEILSETLNDSLEDSGIELIPRGEPGEAEQEIVDVLQRLDIPFLFVLDSHGESPEDRQEQVAQNLEIPPNRVRILSKYGIESYLKDVPEAIADAFELDTEYVSQFISENSTEMNEQGAISELYQSELGQSYSKKNHGPMIALKIQENQVPDELAEAIDAMNSIGWN